MYSGYGAIARAERDVRKEAKGSSQSFECRWPDGVKARKDVRSERHSGFPSWEINRRGFRRQAWLGGWLSGFRAARSS